MSTTRQDDRGLKLARELDQKIDTWIAEFIAIMESEEDSEGRNVGFFVISQNSGRISKLRDFFFTLTVTALYFSASRLSAIYKVPQLAILDEAPVRALQNQLNTRLDGFITEAEMFAAATEPDLVSDLTQRLVFSPGNRNLLRKGAEFAAEFSIENGIWQSGMPHFPQKGLVVTFDDKTTQLCRERMAGQIKPWNEPFVDPESGSEWMHPPFVGGKLPADELFHCCRTVMVPANTRI